MSLNGNDAYEFNYRPHLPASCQAPILDIGCGSGDFLAYLERQGFRNLTGLEVDPARAETSRQRTTSRVETIGDLAEYLQGRGERYQLITLKSVIAHFPRPKLTEYLRAIRGSLADEGTLVVETFNASRWTGQFIYFNDNTHHWAFTEYSLREALESAGLRVVTLAGESLPAAGLRGKLWRALQALWVACLKAIYFAERGLDRKPRIFTKYLIAVCRPA